YLSGWAESTALWYIEGDSIVATVKGLWFSQYGYPEIIITDNGSSLAQGAFKYCTQHKIMLWPAAPSHPQTNGMVEQFNGFVVAQIRQNLVHEGKNDTEWTSV
ncbi:hypothetical protein BGZ46_006968, partial [Entomortierella lignicola]